jgi:hypothetical protein
LFSEHNDKSPIAKLIWPRLLLGPRLVLTVSEEEAVIAHQAHHAVLIDLVTQPMMAIETSSSISVNPL